MNAYPLKRVWWRTLLFSLIGRLVKKPDGKVPPLPKKPKRILVLTPVLRGDYIILSPLLSGISRAYPQAEIAVVVTRASRELAEADPIVDRVLLYRKLPAWYKSVWEIFNYRPCIVVLPKAHPAFTESLMLLLSRSPFRVGLSHPYHDAFLTHPVHHEQENEHRTEAYARLLAPFGIDPSDVNRRLIIGKKPESEKMAELFISKHGEGLWITINISAGSGARFWQTEQWKKLIRCLTESRREIKILIIGSPADRAQCQGVAREFDNVYTVDTPGFLDAAALLAKTKLLISPDTGTVHAAAARNVPVVVLYNGDKINYVRFSPESVPHRAVFAEEGKDVTTISFREVFHEVIHLLVEIEL
ncbi:MAG: glycosyltransferase family 9 protein [Candidatus Electryonea clarkiae]|nr:glycosyltransferase family 9 protein [Candidatus Electryonea clarkiae]MDP8288952.1 glycosyltransferase family 9 protein [Candidatus Electryonea clarkiae]